MRKKKDDLIFKDIPTSNNNYVEEEKEDTSFVDLTSSQSKKTSNKEKPEKGKMGVNRIIQCFAYFSVVLIAIVMIFRLIFKNSPKIADYFGYVSEFLAYIVCIWVGFYFTRKQNSKWWLAGWLISIAVLLIFYIFVLS